MYNKHAADMKVLGMLEKSIIVVKRKQLINVHIFICLETEEMYANRHFLQ